jgi:hypothetical protein
MSYIIKSTSPFVSIKLTEMGRENLSKGQLNFSYWAIGDSELNYDREAIVDANQSNASLSGASKVLRPFDRQPNIKSFITTTDGERLTSLAAQNINVVKAVVNNKATERGFFSGSSMSYNTITGSPYTQSIVTVNNSTITGGTVLYVSTATTINVGDFIRIKVNNNVITPNMLENTTPLPNLWFKVQAIGITGGPTKMVTVDRRLPNLSTQSATGSYVFVYKGGEVADSYGYETSTAYWDSGTLSFDSATNITCDDVKIWNMNNVWCENLAGITGLSTTKLYEDYTKFGSYNYLGTKNPYLEYICSSNNSTTIDNCARGANFSYVDTVSKSISILHYTNNTISNLYGEFFYIDGPKNKTLGITIPDIMYHRRDYATSSGTTMGMRFISSGMTQMIGDSQIEYINLIEDPALIGAATPQIVGKILPQLKMVVIDNDEIVAAMSYKSNRNWTLPPLSAFLSAPTGGTTNGLVDVGKTIYLTYTLENNTGTGLTTSLPCQTYIKVTNTTSGTKDVSFNISDVDLLPYMRKIEAPGYDGLGFYAYNFKLLYQIVGDENERPDPSAWKVYDYTSTLITQTGSTTINPILLENQTPASNGFVLNTSLDSIATTFDLITTLSMAPNTQPEILQFGDERFFYGNLETYIGATIYKTLFDINVNTSKYSLTTNPTRSQQTTTNPPNIKVTEVGIYDSSQNLVVIGKLSEPVALLPGQTIMLELGIDF